MKHYHALPASRFPATVQATIYEVYDGKACAVFATDDAARDH